MVLYILYDRGYNTHKGDKILTYYSSSRHNYSSQHNYSKFIRNFTYINYLAFALHQTMSSNPASVELYS